MSAVEDDVHAPEKLRLDLPAGVHVEAEGRDTRMVLLVILAVVACVGAIFYHDVNERDAMARLEASSANSERHLSDMKCLLAVPEKDRLNSLCLSDAQRERALARRER